MLNIDNKISPLPRQRYIAYCGCSIGSDACWRKQRKQ